MACCSLMLFIFGGFITILTLLRIYIKVTTKWCNSQTCLIGKTAIVTGANTGLGYETALDFAKRGARVILACRNHEKAEEAKSRIIEETGNDNVIVKILDLASLPSIRDFAKDVNATEEKLDILVNNAAVVHSENRTTEDRLPLLMQINYFGPFLLTILLLGLLKKTTKSRIVNVASRTAKYTKLDITKLNEFPKISCHLYFRSKLCNILFTTELASKLHGTSVTTYSVHPGFVITDIIKDRKRWIKTYKRFAAKIFKNAKEGAQTQIYVSVAQRIENLNGEHFHECHRVEPYESAMDKNLARELWTVTEKLVKLTSEEKNVLSSKKQI